MKPRLFAGLVTIWLLFSSFNLKAQIVGGELSVATVRADKFGIQINYFFHLRLWRE